MTLKHVTGSCKKWCLHGRARLILSKLYPSGDGKKITANGPSYFLVHARTDANGFTFQFDGRLDLFAHLWPTGARTEASGRTDAAYPPHGCN